MMQYSTVQKEILVLYRQFLNLTKNHTDLRNLVKAEFKKNATLSRLDTITIDSCLRRGRRQLEMLKNSSVYRTSVFRIVSSVNK